MADALTARPNVPAIVAVTVILLGVVAMGLLPADRTAAAREPADRDRPDAGAVGFLFG